MQFWRAISRRLQWLGWSGLIVLASVGFLSYKYEDFKEDFPRLITWQLRAYQGITKLFLKKPQAHWVVPIEVDDTTFYDFLRKKTRNEVTDRRYLAQLVRTATQARAAVIALDINLDAAAADNPSNRVTAISKDDRDFFDAILAAQKAHVPVVLTFGFRPDMVPVPQIFDNEPVLDDNRAALNTFAGISFTFPEDENPERKFWAPRYGFDHPAEDLRKVPLVAIGTEEHEVGKARRSFDFYSFALQTVDAYYRWILANNPAAQPPLFIDPRWKKELTGYEFVYTTFMPVEDFVSPKLRIPGATELPAISAVELYCDNPFPGERDWNKEICGKLDSNRKQSIPDVIRGKIVLIGGDRHGYKGEKGSEDYLDDHESPVGRLRGMYFQANYIEGLLDHRILRTVPRGAAAAFDVLFGAYVVWVTRRIHNFWARIGVIFLLLLVPCALAVIAALVGYCFDFVFPLVLLLLDPALHKYVDLIPGLEHKEHAHA